MAAAGTPEAEWSTGGHDPRRRIELVVYPAVFALYLHSSAPNSLVARCLRDDGLWGGVRTIEDAGRPETSQDQQQ